MYSRSNVTQFELNIMAYISINLFGLCRPRPIFVKGARKEAKSTYRNKLKLKKANS